MPAQTISINQPTRSGARRTLSLTPLIDVIFMLLLFFMLVTNFERWRIVEIQPPAQSKSAAPSLNQKIVLVRVRENRIDLAGKAVTIDQLPQAIEPLIARTPEAVVVVRTGSSVKTQMLIDVLDALRVAGVEQPTLSPDNDSQ